MPANEETLEASQILFDGTLTADERASRLMPLVFSQLRLIAQRQMATERPDHTLQPTALVNEAFLKLFGDRVVPWQSRAHFCVAAAEAMRRILIDHARTKRRIKRGGEARKLPINLLSLTVEDDPELIAIMDQALDRLQGENPEAAQIVQLRFYAGRSLREISEMLGIPERTLDRRWKFARAWLHRELAAGIEDPRRSADQGDAQ